MALLRALRPAAFLLFVLVAPGLRAAGPELFAMDNGVGRGTWTSAEQAATLKEFGYQGISYNYTQPSDLRVWLRELSAAGLRFYGLYAPARIGTEPTFPPGLEEAVGMLRGTGAVLWLILPNPPRPGDHEAEAVRKIQEAADLAARAGIRVVLYPHRGFYLATAEQALALALKAGRANVGVTVNLAHELAAGHGARLPDILRRVAPCLAMVTLNGATDAPSTPIWDNYIQRLGEGKYDVPGLLRVLQQIGYQGPVGLQFYNVKGEARANLRAAIDAWRKMQPDPAR